MTGRFVALLLAGLLWPVPTLAHTDGPLHKCKSVSGCEAAETYYMHAFKVAEQSGDRDESCADMVSFMAAEGVHGMLSDDASVLTDSVQVADVIISRCDDAYTTRARMFKQRVRKILDDE